MGGAARCCCRAQSELDGGGRQAAAHRRRQTRRRMQASGWCWDAAVRCCSAWGDGRVGSSSGSCCPTPPPAPRCRTQSRLLRQRCTARQREGGTRWLQRLHLAAHVHVVEGSHQEMRQMGACGLLIGLLHGLPPTSIARDARLDDASERCYSTARIDLPAPCCSCPMRRP